MASWTDRQPERVLVRCLSCDVAATIPVGPRLPGTADAFLADHEHCLTQLDLSGAGTDLRSLADVLDRWRTR